MKIALVCAAGGHLSQMRLLLPAFAGHEVRWITDRSPRTAEIADAHMYKEPHYNIFAYAWLFLRALWDLARDRPKLLVSTGSQVAIPFLFAARMLWIRVIYIDSLTRVQSKSVTGRVAIWLAHEFYVQWPHMTSVYGRHAQYKGGLL